MDLDGLEMTLSLIAVEPERYISQEYRYLRWGWEIATCEKLTRESFDKWKEKQEQ